jgi:hypothetical protein
VRIALNATFPAFLWIPVDSAKGFRAVHQTYFKPSEELPQVARFSLGIADFFTIEERLLDDNPFCEPHAVDKDVAEHRGKPMHEFTVRTRYSRSLVNVASYGALVIATVRYRPAAEAAVIRENNALLGRAYPLDLPVDIAALLLEYPVADPAELLADLHDDQPPQMHVLALITMELLGTPLTEADLRPLEAASDPELRRAIASVASQRGFQDVLRRMVAVETHPKLRAHFAELLGH